MVSGLQLNATTGSSEEDDDFHTQLPSSYQFKLQSMDLVKLKSIQTTKINKKRCRLFEERGLPIEVDKISNEKKIFLSKKKKTTSATIEPGVETSGNFIQMHQNFTVFYVLN